MGATRDRDRLVEAMADGVVQVDAEGRIADANGAAEGILGRAGGSLVGRQLRGVAPSLAAPIADADADAAPIRTTVDLGAGGGSDCAVRYAPLSSPAGDDRDAGDGWVITLRERQEGGETEDREPSDGPADDRPDDGEPGDPLDSYRTVLEHVGDPVYVLDAERTITFANPAAVELSGYPRDVLVGSGVDMLVPEEGVRRGDRLVEELLATDRDRGTYEMAVITRDGERIPVENNVTLLPPEDGQFRGSVGVLRDVSERKAREAELGQYETIVETVADPVYATDADGYFTFVNRAFEEATGYDRERVAEREFHFSDFTADEHTETVLEAVRDLLADDDRTRAIIDIEGISRDGRRIPMEDRIALLPAPQGEFQGTAGVLRDVSERERRREVLSVMNRALRHNLRTQVNTIVGFADIAGEHLDPEHREYIDRVIESAEWLARLGDTLRNLQDALEEGRESELAVDLGKLVESIVAEYREEYDRAALETHVTVDATVDAGSALEHAIEHLVENAIVHNDGDRPEVHVWVSSATQQGWVDVHVEDDGPGIPEAEREVVLGEASITQLQHGSGIGLWLTRWIVEVFDGEVRIEDNDPRGTVVTLRLRRADVPGRGRTGTGEFPVEDDGGG